MPTAIIFQGTAASNVPAPAVGGRSLFANINDGGRLYAKLPNGTIEALDATFAPVSCCGPCGGGGGACDCAAVANCIDTDTNVQNSLTTFVTNLFNTTLTLGGLSDVDLTGLNVNDVIQRDGANWVPVALPAGGTDELVKITANDTTAGYLFDKVVAGVNNNIVLTELNDGADEDLEIALNTTLTNLVDVNTQDFSATGDVDFTNADIDIVGGTFDIDATTTVNIDTATINNLTITNPPTIPGLEQVQETPAGAINGVNTIFTLSFAPTNNIITLFVGGVPQHPTVNYTVVGTTLTFTTAPSAGPITATYFK